MRRREDGQRASAGDLENRQTIAGDKRHGVFVDRPTEAILLPVLCDIAPDKARLVVDGEPLQSTVVLVGDRLLIGGSDHLLAQEIAASVDGVAQAAFEDPEGDAVGECQFEARMIRSNLARSHLILRLTAPDLFGLAWQVGAAPGVAGNHEWRVPERVPFFAFNNRGRQAAGQFSERCHLLF